MRFIVFSVMYSFLAISFTAYAQDVDPFTSSNDDIEAADDKANTSVAANAQDPFAAIGGADLTIDDGSRATTPADEIDPFVSSNVSATDGKSRTSGSLDFIYQANYLPDLIRADSKDQFESQAFLDAVITLAVTDAAKFRARGILSRIDKKTGSIARHSSDIVALEYFYEQRFAEQTQVLSIGRKNIGWSAGFQWRPADLIENGFTTKNVDTLDPNRYRGVDQVQYEAIQPAFNFVAILSNHEKRFFKGEQFAAKIGVKSFADFSLVYAKSGSYSTKYGLIVDSNLPWATTFVLEAVHVDIDKEKLTDPFYFGERLESLSGINSYEDIYIGLTKFIDDKRRISFEYFRNGRGTKSALTGTLSNKLGLEMPASKAINSSIFTEEYLGRNYVYTTYTGYIDDLKLQVKPSVLMNTDDSSYIGSISFNRELGGNSELSLNITTFNGDSLSEFGSISRGVGVSASYIIHVF
jgi:hypothetical protein